MTHEYVDFCTEKGLEIVDLGHPRTLRPDRVAVA